MYFIDNKNIKCKFVCITALYVSCDYCDINIPICRLIHYWYPTTLPIQTLHILLLVSALEGTNYGRNIVDNIENFQAKCWIIPINFKWNNI